MTHRLLHISDLHFGRPYVPEAGEALLEQARELEPDCIVVSGDLTQRAKVSQFRSARLFLDRLPLCPMMVVAGNHDIPLYRFWERLFAPYRNYLAFLPGRLDTVLTLPWATIVGLNSTSPYGRIRGGRLSDAQLALCESRFRSAPPEHLRVVVHHHQLNSALVGHESIRNAEAVVEAYDRLGVDLVLAGHIHFAHAESIRSIVPKLEHARTWIVHCGTTVSSRNRPPEADSNSFNWIAVDRSEIRVTTYVCDRRASKRFEPRTGIVIKRHASVG